MKNFTELLTAVIEEQERREELILNNIIEGIDGLSNDNSRKSAVFAIVTDCALSVVEAAAEGEDSYKLCLLKKIAEGLILKYDHLFQGNDDEKSFSKLFGPISQN